MHPLVQKAAEFAETAHASIDQRRKYTNEPYIVHPRAVAELVETVPHTPEMVAAAWLHDTRENVPSVTHEILVQEMGIEVAVYVEELTDKSTLADGSRKTRKKLDRQRLKDISPEAQTVKLADVVVNLRDIVDRDPGFAKTYIPENALRLPYLIKGDSTLLGMAFKLLIDAAQRLNIRLEFAEPHAF